jgi:uncharacterized protein YbjT (DUF2867 family)
MFVKRNKGMLLVTGASGLNGSAIIREFVRHGAAVRAMVRNREKGAQFSGAMVDVVAGDMSRLETLGRALEGVHRVLMISSASPDMVEVQCRFIDACKAAGIGHIIKFSGAESNIGYDPNRFRFARMHLDIERYLETSGPAWTHLRPSQFMQVYLRDAPAIVTQRVLRLPMAEVAMSPIDVDDIAKIAFAIMCSEGHEGKAYAMTGPESLTMHEIAEHIANATGKPLRYVAISPEERRQNLMASGMPRYLADALVMKQGSPRKTWK